MMTTKPMCWSIHFVTINDEMETTLVSTSGNFIDSYYNLSE